MELRNYDAGEIIFDEGMPSDYAYIIVSGQVEIYKRTSEGGTIRLALLNKGEIFGEMGIVDEKPRSAAAVARHPVTLQPVSQDQFLDMLFSRPEEALPIVKVLFERLRMMNTRYVERIEPDLVPYSPTATVNLVPLTPEVTGPLPLTGIVVREFPFRIGRDPTGTATSPLDWNDLAFRDTEPYRLSLNHFMIDRTPRGITVRDRGSRFGTMVNGVRVGGLARTNAALLTRRVNEIVAGPAQSPFRFHLLIDEGSDHRP